MSALIRKGVGAAGLNSFPSSFGLTRERYPTPISVPAIGLRVAPAVKPTDVSSPLRIAVAALGVAATAWVSRTLKFMICRPAPIESQSLIWKEAMGVTLKDDTFDVRP